MCTSVVDIDGADRKAPRYLDIRHYSLNSINNKIDKLVFTIQQLGEQPSRKAPIAAKRKARSLESTG